MREHPRKSALEHAAVLLRNQHRVCGRLCTFGNQICRPAVLLGDRAMTLERGSNRRGNAWRTHQVLGRWLGSTEHLELACQVIGNVVAKKPNVAMLPSPPEESGLT